MVLHKELGGGTVSVVHLKETGEAGELVVGPLQPAEQARDHWGRALEAVAAWPRWGAGVPHLLPPSGHPTGGKDAADVDVQWPDGP